MKRLLPLFIVLLAMASCRERHPATVLSEQKMEDIVYDFHLAEAVAEDRGDSAVALFQLYRQSVLRKYGVSQAQYDSSMNWYARHTDRLYKIYTRVAERYSQTAQREQPRRDKKKRVVARTGDTANVWRGPTSQLLSVRGLRNRMEFVVKADTSFHPRDKFVFHANTLFTYEDGRRQAIVVLNVRYQNSDSVTAVVQNVYGVSQFDVSVTAANLPISQIDGFVYIDEMWSDRVKLLFLSDIQLLRYHNNPAAPAASATGHAAADSAHLPLSVNKNAVVDEQKRFVDSIQRQATQPAATHGHFKEVDNHSHSNNPLLQRQQNVGRRH